MTEADREHVIDVLAAAFHDYPVMRFALADAGAEYDEQLRELIGFYCDARLTRGWPVLGIRQGQEVVAAALVSEPRNVVAPPELRRKHRRVARIIGREAFERMARYERQSTGHEPDEPHYFLGMIGVAPGHQGSGYGRLLLEHIQVMSEGDPVSTGVVAQHGRSVERGVLRAVGVPSDRRSRRGRHPRLVHVPAESLVALDALR